MNKKLLYTLNRSLESTKTTHYTPVTIDALQARLTEELDWLDADPGRECLIVLLQELAAKMRSARIVVNPGYSYLPDSYLLFLTGVTHVNPVEWDLPFSRFILSVGNRPVIPFEVGTGGLEVARKILSGRENELIVEPEPGLFEITFLDGIELTSATLRLITYPELDRFTRTLKEGWHPLDEATLKLFRRGATDGALFFESDKIREWLFEFDPESMSDLVLLNALYHPDRIQMYETALERKKAPASIRVYENALINRVLRDSYALPVYQEQALLLKDVPNANMMGLFNKLAPKGHFIGRTMMAVEALWPYRNKTKLK
jgi:hypothetical protein